MKELLQRMNEIKVMDACLSEGSRESDSSIYGKEFEKWADKMAAKRKQDKKDDEEMEKKAYAEVFTPEVWAELAKAYEKIEKERDKEREALLKKALKRSKLKGEDVSHEDEIEEGENKNLILSMRISSTTILSKMAMNKKFYQDFL